MAMYPNVNWELVPEHIRGGLKRYIDNGIPPGSFLTAVLSNDLMEAFGCADYINRHRLFDIVSFLYGSAPAGCWGSPERVASWIERGGLSEAA